MLLAAGATVAVGGATADTSVNLGHARKTFFFRWLYWQASTKMIAEHPLLGVGPANFGAAYLRDRDVRGEETVKSPHNFVFESLAEDGIPGGACYVAVLGAMVFGACRPRPRDGAVPPPPSAEPAPFVKVPLALFVALPLAVIFARWYFAGSTGWLWILDALAPAVMLAAMLAVAWWCCGLPQNLAGMAPLRIALGAGVAAVLLYEVISFNLVMPSAAGLFFLALGAVLGQAGASPARAAQSAALPGSNPTPGILARIVAPAAVLDGDLRCRSPALVAGLSAPRSRRRTCRRRWVGRIGPPRSGSAKRPPAPMSSTRRPPPMPAKAYGLWWAQDAMGDRLASPRKHQAARDHLEKAYGWAGQAVGRDRQDASWEQTRLGHRVDGRQTR